jgi:hypothetical protein
MTISKKLKSMKDAAIDSIDKASGPTSRAGGTLERIAKMTKAGVSARAIATQLEDNSHTRQQYTVEHVEGFKMLFKDVQTKVGVTAAQARAMMADQQNVKNTNAPTVAAPNPT